MRSRMMKAMRVTGSLVRLRRLLGFAALAAVSSFVMLFVSYVLLMTAFMEHGPTGPIEPAWIGQTAVYAPIVFTSCVASVVFTDSRRASWSANLLLGFLVGALVSFAWLLIHWLRGDSFSDYDRWGWLIPPALGAYGSLLGTALRRTVSRNNPYW